MYKALFVEDEVTVREGVVNKIDWEEHGFQLIGACENGRQAMEVLEKRGGVDLLITDINMPLMDGLELSKNVREHWPETKIVLLTGFDSFDYAQQAIRYKVHNYILKPITSKQLKELLWELSRELDTRLPNVKQAWSVMRENFLEQLLGERIPPETAEQAIRDFTIQLTEGPYSATVIDTCPVSGKPEFLQQIKGKLGENGEVLYDEHKDLVLLCGGGDPKRYIMTLLTDVTDDKQNRLTAITGKMVASLGDIRESYADARLGMQHLFQLDGGVLYDSMSILSAGRKELEVDKRAKQIVKSVRFSQRDKVGELLLEYTSSFKQSGWKKEAIIEVFNNLILLLKEYAEEQGVSTLRRARRTLDSTRNLNEAHAYLQQFIDHIMDSCEQKWHGSSKKAAQAVEYIKANYSKTDLSLNEVTSYLSVSTSYFSAVFKAHTECTFVEFLTKVRMEKAMELLGKTDMKNYEIADAVGYDDPAYFRHAFKKHAGMTPSEYRKKA